ncbi:DUF981 domain-containing protein [Helcobacillus massiliensis]|uniref:DUF981 family protein n=1 Tax=Helcobacillus massiliensis TaxID=521392 RepID=A0A839QSS2_9MICO|nr:DUF981 family protein [Helcobacillus massiliensis]MBB3021879.1 hypothetical protein [Helcobacillus massiliensis]MCT1557784.1 DUF981 domain-containing protein [Helcobacillus massiliensis]MCT2036978.1 DUF981 domain-containing protein [Helcobacillus massiliensis]MCT2332191.1 DUF981 domain-containing protein [Helcobacillus massiliensis]
MIIYNTIMALAVGAALLTLIQFGRTVLTGEPNPTGTIAGRASLDGYSLIFGILGVILTVTGLHMTLTWPLNALPFDNIIFGEPSLAFGLLLLAASFYIWSRRSELAEMPDPGVHLAQVLGPFRFWFIGLGLALIAVFFVGNIFQLFAAPPHEPISGAFAQWPWLEAFIISGLYGINGLALVLLPTALKSTASQSPDSGAVRPSGLLRAVGWMLAVPGVFWLLFGALNYYTHVGMISNEIEMGLR